MQDIGAVNDFQCFAHIMVGDQHANATVLQMLDQITDFANRDGVNAGQRLIQQDIGRVGRQGARDFAAPAFTARKRQRGCAAQMRNAEFRQQFIQHRGTTITFWLHYFKRGADILFHGQAAKDAGFLRQIAKPKPRTAIHGQHGHIMPIHHHAPFIGLHQAGDHVEGCCLTRAIRPKQPHRFPALERKRHIAHHRSLFVALAEPGCVKPTSAGNDLHWGRVIHR